MRATVAHRPSDQAKKANKKRETVVDSNAAGRNPHRNLHRPQPHPLDTIHPPPTTPTELTVYVHSAASHTKLQTRYALAGLDRHVQTIDRNQAW